MLVVDRSAGTCPAVGTCLCRATVGLGPLMRCYSAAERIPTMSPVRILAADAPLTAGNLLDGDLRDHGRIASPSTLAMASVSFLMIASFSVTLKTPSMTPPEYVALLVPVWAFLAMTGSIWASGRGNGVAVEEPGDRSGDGSRLLDVKEVADAVDQAVLDVRH